jgi:succinate dehydrogenase/fumarate reductase-like Fe-S protein
VETREEEEEEELKMADGEFKQTNATCDRLQEGRRCIVCGKILN